MHISYFLLTKKKVFWLQFLFAYSPIAYLEREYIFDNLSSEYI